MITQKKNAINFLKLSQAGLVAGLTLLAAACSGEKSQPSAAQSQEVAAAMKATEEATARAEQAEKDLLKAQEELKAKQDAEEKQKAAEAEEKAAAELAAAKQAQASAERRAEKAEAARKASARREHASTVAAAQPAPRASEPAPVCGDCGTVYSITPVATQGEGTGMGAVAGAVAGAVIGHQFGRGKGNTAAKIGGAVLGGYAGNEAEKRIRGGTTYDVTVRMDAGGTRTVRVADATSLSTGERVRVEGNNVVRM